MKLWDFDFVTSARNLPEILALSDCLGLDYVSGSDVRLPSPHVQAPRNGVPSILIGEVLEHHRFRDDPCCLSLSMAKFISALSLGSVVHRTPRKYTRVGNFLLQLARISMLVRRRISIFKVHASMLYQTV